MSPVKVHGMNLSAPCRLVYLTCEAVGIEYEKVDVDLMNGGTRTPEYLKVCHYFWFYVNHQIYQSILWLWILTDQFNQYFSWLNILPLLFL